MGLGRCSGLAGVSPVLLVRLRGRSQAPVALAWAALDTPLRSKGSAECTPDHGVHSPDWRRGHLAVLLLVIQVDEF